MAGRRGTAADLPTLKTLWAGAQATYPWPGGVCLEPRWAEHDIFVSTDAKGVRFGIVTQRHQHIDFIIPGLTAPVPLDERLLNYVGPRAGIAITSNTMLTCVKEACGAWMVDALTRFPSTAIGWGIVPATWEAAFKSLFATQGHNVLNVPAAWWRENPTADWILYWQPIGVSATWAKP